MGRPIGEYQFVDDEEIVNVSADGWHRDSEDPGVLVFWQHYITPEARRRDVLRVRADAHSVLRLAP